MRRWDQETQSLVNTTLVLAADKKSLGLIHYDQAGNPAHKSVMHLASLTSVTREINGDETLQNAVQHKLVDRCVQLESPHFVETLVLSSNEERCAIYSVLKVLW